MQEKGHGARYAVRYLVPLPAADAAAATHKPEDGHTKVEKRAQALREPQLKQLVDDTAEEHAALLAKLRAAAAHAALDTEPTESKTVFMTKSLSVLAEALACAVADKMFEGLLLLADELTSTVLPTENPHRTPKSVKMRQDSHSERRGAGQDSH